MTARGAATAVALFVAIASGAWAIDAEPYREAVEDVEIEVGRGIVLGNDELEPARTESVAVNLWLSPESWRLSVPFTRYSVGTRAKQDGVLPLGDLDVSHNCGATAVGVSVAETHSELTGLQWQLGDGEWNDLTLDANSFGFGTPHTAERRLTVKATNSAGLEASVEAMVRGPAGCGDPAPAPDETDGDGPPDPVTPADPPTDVEGAKISGGGGCATVLPTALVAWGPIRR